jgi:hypothetical protein
MLTWKQVLDLVNANTWDDVVLIADTCNAAEMTTERDTPEFLGAVASNTIAASSARDSFTQALIDKLKVLGGAPTTISYLHKLLLEDLRKANDLKDTPFYSTHKDKNSVTLFALPSRRSPSPAPAKPISAGGECWINLKITLAQNAPRLTSEAWTQWLDSSNLPTGVRDIEIAYGYQENSQAYFVTVPVDIWYYLPTRAAYRFVGTMAPGARLVPKPLALASVDPNAPKKDRRPSVAGGSRPGSSGGPGGSTSTRPRSMGFPSAFTPLPYRD